MIEFIGDVPGTQRLSEAPGGHYEGSHIIPECSYGSLHFSYLDSSDFNKYADDDKCMLYACNDPAVKIVQYSKAALRVCKPVSNVSFQLLQAERS